jgi:hypothetical protein
VKVHIVHLDLHDDYVSARDKLGWAKSPRVLIVWPKYGRILHRRLDLVLLQRFAAQHSLQIGLVTNDPGVLDHADVLAIPAFESVDAVTDAGWRRRARRRSKAAGPRPRKKEASIARLESTNDLADRPPSTPLKILRALLLVVVLVTLGGLAILIVSRAELIISPPIEAQTTNLLLHVDPALVVPEADGAIPGQILTVQVSDELRLPTSGEIALPATSARGFVTFTNLTSDTIEIPAGTGLRASAYEDQRFVTTENVSLPGEIGAQAEAAIEATTLGPAGNLPSGAIDAVEGTLGLQVEVNNIVYLSGGENEIHGAVAEADFKRLEDKLQENLEAQALQQLSALLHEQQILLSQSLRLTQVDQRTFDRALGDPADTLALSMDVEYSVFAYRNSDAQTAAERVLADQIPAGYAPVPHSFGFEVLEEGSQIRSDVVDLAARAWQDIYIPADKDMLREILRWERPARAVALVSQNIRRCTSIPDGCRESRSSQRESPFTILGR